MTKQLLRRAVVTMAIVLAVRPMDGSAATSLLDGPWTGRIRTLASSPGGIASGMLVQTRRRVSGRLAIDVGALSDTFDVTGRLHGRRAVVSGAHGARQLYWHGRWSAAAQGWSGPIVVRGAGMRVRGTLTLARPGDGGGAPRCGEDFFASTVMPVVIEPICSKCHVPGGQAQAAAFRVTVGSAAQTATSALAMVDPADPGNSRIIAKPRGDVPHGGGRRIVAGSPEEHALLTWIAQVTAPGCDLGGANPGGGGGNGGGGGGGPGADLYAANCASCHGPDARGLDGRPDIHCHRDIRDAVRNGRAGGPLGDMPAFPALGDGAIADIQTFLLGLCPVGGATGAELYASQCASCHGGDATGSASAPSVRCATRVDDALVVGRGARMPSFPALIATERTSIAGFLGGLCDAAGRSGADLYAGNCSTCHGATAGGGTNGLGTHGPDIRCTEAGDYREKVRFGDEGMPAFPVLHSSDISALTAFVRGTFCTGG